MTGMVLGCLLFVKQCFDIYVSIQPKTWKNYLMFIKFLVNHLREFDNLCDFIGYVTWLSYTTIKFGFPQYSDTIIYRYLDMLSLIFVLLRGIVMTFNLFRSTRYLITMIKMVSISLAGFFNILFALNLWFSFIFLKLDTMGESYTEGQSTLQRSIQHTWDLMLISSNYDFQTDVGWGIKWIA